MKTIEIARHTDAIGVMRVLADNGKISGDVVGLRFFQRDRLPLVYRMVTDRDSNSKIYKDEGDARGDHAERADQITYLRVVNFRQDPPVSIPLFRTPSLSVDNMSYLAHLPPDRCQILYDLQKLWRAADNEFYFTVNPLQAVIATLVVK